MMRKIGLALAITTSFLFLNTGFIYSQESIAPEQPKLTSETEVQWLWGEVASLDLQNKSFLVKYLDYETETEKEINIIVNEETIYENVKSIEEIKSQYTVSVDYIVNPDGKNIAKNITVDIEKSESQKTLPEEIKPEEITPEYSP